MAQPVTNPRGAAAKVFAVPELLENILEHLSAVQLFGFQRVNTNFKDITTTSMRLRRTMFTIEDDKITGADVEEVLKDSRLARAIFPFHVELGRMCGIGRGIYVKIFISGLHQPRPAYPVRPSWFDSVRAACTNKSWRDIKLSCKDEEELDVDLYCGVECIWGSFSIKAGDTLGALIDKSIMKIVAAVPAGQSICCDRLL